MCSGSVLQIPYLCINGDLKMKRDNLVGEWRLFRQNPGGLCRCLLLERGEIEAGVRQVNACAVCLERV